MRAPKSPIILSQLFHDQPSVFLVSGQLRNNLSILCKNDWLINSFIYWFIDWFIHVDWLIDWLAGNTFQLYEGITEIPSEFAKISLTIVDTTRKVCREMCNSILYSDRCSGFLYDRSTRSCTITPYTGEWLNADQNNSKPNQRVEFYRRSRCLGNLDLFSSKLRANEETYISEFF